MILTPQDKKFINFHAHTSLSVQDALTTPEDLVLGAKALGHESCCVSEHGHMASFPLFVKACDKHGINFRLATEFYFQWEHQKKDKMSHHLLVIVKNDVGYQNMLRLQHWSNVKVDDGGGFYGRPRITEKMLEQFKDGLIISSACLSGPVTYHLHRGDIAQATLAAEYFRDNYENFYLELMPHRLDVQSAVNPKIVSLGKQLGIPVITTLDVHFKDKSYENAYLANGDLRRNRTISDRNDPNSDCLRDPDFWYKSPEEIVEIYDQQGIDRIDVIETFKNTLEIDSMIDFSWKERHFDFPVFCENADKELLKMLREKAAVKFNGSVPDEVKSRVNEEYQVIKKMGYSNYFLILNDAMEFCDANNIARGAGRGSAGACMILYILGITKINPLEYGLAFSRFLNEYRKSAPDVDLDLQPIGREMLIQYLQRKYGEDRIVQVVNYSEMRPKAAIKDACKWMEVDFKIANEITSHIPSKEHDEEGNLVDLDWEDAMKHVPIPVKNQYGEVLDIAEKLSGSYRTFGKHAGAVCVLPKPATEIIPVMKGKDDDGPHCLVSQWDKNILDSVGVHKYDFLGLSTLTVLKECEKLTGIKDEDIPLDDQKTWDFIRDARFMFGVFQLSEPKTKRFLREVKPQNISELADVNTLIRPGSDSTTYLANKASDEIYYRFDLPEVRDILSRTYGAIIYQEQIINLSSRLSEMDLGEGDLMRRAFEKNDLDKIKYYKNRFESTCIYPELKTDLFNWIKDSCQYLFCQPHGVSYSLISYYTAFYKINYPEQFLVANLRHPKSGAKFTEAEYMGEFINEARNMGIKIKMSDNLNRFTQTDFSSDTVYIGLENLTHFSETPARMICEAKSQDFEDMVDELMSIKVDGREKMDGTLSKRSIMNKRHFWRLVQIEFFGPFDQYRQRYIDKFKLKEKDYPKDQTVNEAINEALGFEFVSKIAEVWNTYEQKILSSGRDPADYRVIRIEKADLKNGKFGSYYLIRGVTNSGSNQTIFYSANRGDKLLNLKKGDLCLMKVVVKDETTLRTSNVSVLS